MRCSIEGFPHERGIWHRGQRLDIASIFAPPVVEADMAGWLSDLPSRDLNSFTSIETSGKPTIASFAKARDPAWRTSEHVLGIGEPLHSTAQHVGGLTMGSVRRNAAQLDTLRPTTGQSRRLTRVRLVSPHAPFIIAGNCHYCQVQSL